jgi:hypothetical protein
VNSPLQTPLEDFIKTNVKLPVANLPLVDWLEIESKLNAPRRIVSFSLNKKILGYLAGVLALGIAVVLVVLLIPYVNSIITQEKKIEQPLQESSMVPNEIQPKPVAQSLPPNDSVRAEAVVVDSLSITEREADSVLSAANKLSDKINASKNTLANKPTPKKKGGTEKSTNDSIRIHEEDIIIPPLPEVSAQEIIPNTTPSLTDSTPLPLDQKTKRNRKNRKNKSSSEVQSEPTQKDSTP